MTDFAKRTLECRSETIAGIIESSADENPVERQTGTNDRNMSQTKVAEETNIAQMEKSLSKKQMRKLVGVPLILTALFLIAGFLE